MGHHLYRTFLSTEAQVFWTQTLRGDYGDLDIPTLLNKWPGEAWAFEFSRYMKDSDPILALQVESLSHNRETRDLQSKADFQALLDRGVKTLRVPNTPITGYANKNPEEAFCETLGMLVAYGPMAVHEKIRHWLDVTLPGAVKTADSHSAASKPPTGWIVSHGANGHPIYTRADKRVKIQDASKHSPKRFQLFEYSYGEWQEIGAVASLKQALIMADQAATAPADGKMPHVEEMRLRRMMGGMGCPVCGYTGDPETGAVYDVTYGCPECGNGGIVDEGRYLIAKIAARYKKKKATT